MSYQIKTKKGYDFFEASSALQKSIRRGLEDDALYWAAEFYDSGYDEYCWKRLKVITCEDIGLANPHLPVTIKSLADMYNELNKKRKDGGQPSERLFLVQAVLLLCRSPKSRLVCHASIATFYTHPHTFKEIPDYAYDRHTKRGKQLGRGFDHFFKEGAKLENMGDVDREQDFEQRAIKAISSPSATLFDEID